MDREYTLLTKLKTEHKLNKDEWIYLIKNGDKIKDDIFKTAREIADSSYGKKIFVRGLIEFTNYCKNDCFYCGIRRSNKNAKRYRLTEDEILNCCKTGYGLGFRTFVLQGGEDNYFTDDLLARIILKIKETYSDCALTLSVGEKSFESYKKFYDAGADRFLLRHETASDCHYRKLHPGNLSLSARKECLYSLKEIGYQVGCGMMIGSPYQTDEDLACDMMFLTELSPQMVGIGPFISHIDTPFKDMKNGSTEKTILMLALTRILLPNALLPATTALGTLDKNGREKAVLAGANVVMPNLSPESAKEKYMLYDNKVSAGLEAAEGLKLLSERMEGIGFYIAYERGDYKGFKRI